MYVHRFCRRCKGILNVAPIEKICIISRVLFREEEMVMMSKDSEKVGSNPEIVNFEVEQPLNSNETIIRSSNVSDTSGESIASEPINLEDIEPQEEDLSNYSLARDRHKNHNTFN